MSTVAHRISVSLCSSAGEEIVSLAYLLSFNVKRDIRTPASTMTFSIAKSSMGLRPGVSGTDEVLKLLKPGVVCKAFIDEKQVFFGYATAIQSKPSPDVFEVSCRDVIWRLQNSTIFHARALIGMKNFDAIVKHAIDTQKAFDPKGKPTKWDNDDWLSKALIVYSQKDALTKLTGMPPTADLETETQAVKESDVKPKENENTYGFIKRLIKPWGYVLQASPTGNLMFFRPNRGDYSRFTFRLSKEPKKVWTSKECPIVGDPELNINLEDVHSHYFVYGSSMGKDEARSSICATYVNPNYPVGAPRNNLFQHDNDLTSKDQCMKAAKRLCGFETAKFWNYSFAVAGFGLDNILFSNDVVVTIEDAWNGVSQNCYLMSCEMIATPTSQLTKFEASLTDALVLD